MKAYYGKSGNGYYYSLFMGGLEVGYMRNLTLHQLEEDMKKYKSFEWIDERKKSRRGPLVSIMPR